MRYYVTYRDVEMNVIKYIDSIVLAEREMAYYHYAVKHMKIARNFKKGTGRMVLGATKNYYKLGNVDVPALSNVFYDSGLLSGKNKNALVAASKLLWLFDPNVIIMDRVTIDVLNVKSNDYNHFVAKWETSYCKIEPEIIAIIEQYNFIAIDPIMKEKWFRMRVFDQYLVSQKVNTPPQASRLWL